MENRRLEMKMEQEKRGIKCFENDEVFRSCNHCGASTYSYVGGNSTDYILTGLQLYRLEIPLGQSNQTQVLVFCIDCISDIRQVCEATEDEHEHQVRLARRAKAREDIRKQREQSTKKAGR